MPAEVSAERFTQRLTAITPSRDPAGLASALRAHEDDTFLGVRMREVFDLAKEFVDMPTAEIEKLLASPVHELRVGALSIMDKASRRKKTPPDRRAELYELYLRSPDRINNWDLVDLAAPYAVGGYLYDFGQPRDVLYTLARSKDTWERRTAIVSTLHFVRQGDLDDTFAIAEILLHDEHDLIHKPVGWLLREAGKKDRARLLEFLDRHAATAPRVLLRYAIEHLDPDQRAHYLGRKKAAAG
ncbi:DNA alkylation repair protein [Nonomuraea sp. B12E4]|uniref:DNA alkylation repair protein n=1 Tax=Nonomuraea sp. B12E4 TaxID=3153564 RepID=UPI00325DA672